MARCKIKFYEMLCFMYITIYFILSFFPTCSYGVNYIAFHSPDDCKRGISDGIHEYYDISQLRCQECAQPSTHQTVSSDGLNCICQPRHHLVRDFGGGAIECGKCADNEVATDNGWSCVRCSTSLTLSTQPVCTSCNSRQITVERELNGLWRNTPLTRECETCVNETMPSVHGTRCERCNQILSVGVPDSNTCTCPENSMTGGICFAKSDDLVNDMEQLYRIDFGDDTIDSIYFREHVRAADGMCRPYYANLTSCQILGNMCTVLMYKREYEGNTNFAPQDACSLYLSLTKSESSREYNEWPANMPWLYYLDESATEVLTDTRITTNFNFSSSKLNFLVAKYSLNGSYHGYHSVQNGLIQLCKNSEAIMNAAYTFGTTYNQECEISVREFWDESKYQPDFFDMYLGYEDGGKKLYAIPVLVRNYLNEDNSKVNSGSDPKLWQLVRRFFLVDNINGKTTNTQGGNADAAANSEAEYVRYAQSMTIHITLQDGNSDGNIYPPYLEITYGYTKYDSNTKVKVSFNVEYSMDQSKFNTDMSIAAAVMCALALVYSIIQTWAWSKRAGQITVDFVSILKFLFFCCGNLANAFFVVIFGSSLWWWIFFKEQNTVSMLLPSPEDESMFIGFLAAAFSLKFIHVLHMFVCQVTVDIFFVDWERPQGKVSSDSIEKGHEAPVSIWRTYLIANEWNEIQTIRKINQIFQIFAVVFFLEIVGFGNLATMDPRSDFRLQDDQYYASESRILRFGISIMVYLLIVLVQWVFYTLLYERFIEDKVRQYVDLCSMSNISIFILENKQFGYYIHGRSPHGRADTGMREMHENLKREVDDLCGKRGLGPSSDQQTFQISVPRKLRSLYDRVLQPVTTQQAASGGRVPTNQGGGNTPRSAHIAPQTEKAIQAYGIINRFLQQFIDHAHRDVDYVLKDKLLFESILNMEFQDATETGFFYADGGHSFDAVLFYGNETTLTIFDILVFSIVDLLSQSFVLSAILTYLISQIISMMRDGLGRSNLAKKTLVDKRFLI